MKYENMNINGFIKLLMGIKILNNPEDARRHLGFHLLF